MQGQIAAEQQSGLDIMLLQVTGHRISGKPRLRPDRDQETKPGGFGIRFRPAGEPGCLRQSAFGSPSLLWKSFAREDLVENRADHRRFPV